MVMLDNDLLSVLRDKTMTEEEQLMDLLVSWEERFQDGEDVSPEELCLDCPELLSPLRDRIETIKRMGWLGRAAQQKDLRVDPISHSGTQADTTLQKLFANRYRLDRVIGEGATGRVWQAFDVELGRPVAVKVAREDRPLPMNGTDRFLSEARRVAQLRHPGIVAVHDVGRHGDGCFIVSDLINGTDLRRHLISGRLPILAALRIAAEAAEALHYAHQQGIVHRDVKPGNILLDGAGHVFITDFGIALTREELRQQGGDGSGTLAYMSPEQFSSDGRQLDERTDIYSLGGVLYELVTGEQPFHGQTYPTIKEGVLHTAPRPLRSVNQSIPREAERICLKCLAKDPSARYASAQELARDLRRLIARLSKGRLLLSLVVIGVTLALALYNVYLLTRSVTNGRVLDMQNYDRLIDRGIDSLNRKDYQSAVSHFDSALYVQKTVFLFCLKGEAHLALKEYKKVMGCCEEALRLDPSYPKAYYLKGKVCQANNQPEEALKLFDRAMHELSPNTSKARKEVEAELMRLAAPKEKDIKANPR